MVGLDLPHRCYVQICGIDIVRDRNGDFLVLEDNARTPSGVSYVIENRYLMLRTSDLVAGLRFRRVDAYGPRRNEVARSCRRMPWTRRSSCCRPARSTRPISSMCSSRELGVPLVEGRDLLVRDDQV